MGLFNKKETLCYDTDKPDRSIVYVKRIDTNEQIAIIAFDRETSKYMVSTTNEKANPLFVSKEELIKMAEAMKQLNTAIILPKWVDWKKN